MAIVIDVNKRSLRYFISQCDIQSYTEIMHKIIITTFITLIVINQAFACSLAPNYVYPSFEEKYRAADYIIDAVVEGPGQEWKEYYEFANQNIEDLSLSEKQAVKLKKEQLFTKARTASGKAITQIRNEKNKSYEKTYKFYVIHWLKGQVQGPEYISVKGLGGGGCRSGVPRERAIIFTKGNIAGGVLKANNLGPHSAVFEREWPTDVESKINNPQRTWSTYEDVCTNRLAGYGRRAAATCFDKIHSSARGPLMVVVPNGEGFDKPFAIARYEISVEDWSKYCLLSGTCRAIKDNLRKNDPMTGITLQQAQDYATWLSERTGKTYRIPTKSEWEYAANAGGKQPKKEKDFNCLVSVSGELIKGSGTVSVKSGWSNGWGLKNYVGNVQEWVLTEDGTTMVMGGSYQDECDVSMVKQHNGDADDITGFRLLLENIQ